MAVYSGTFGIANGLDAIIDAAEILQCRGCHNVKFVLIGQGSQKDQLMGRVMSAGLKNVIFIEPLEKKALFEMLRSADVGLQILANVPAFFEATSPNKFFDYLSCGLPVLVNYPGWVANLLEEHACGFSVGATNPEMLASQLADLVTQPSKLNAMSKASLIVAKSFFDRELLAEKWVASVMLAAPKRTAFSGN